MYLGYTNSTDKTEITLPFSGPHDIIWMHNESIILFVIDGDYDSSVYLYNVDSNTFSDAVHTFETPIEALRVSDDGNYLAFATEVYPYMSMTETAQYDEEKRNASAQYYSFNQTFIYHWDTWETGKYKHIMYMKLGFNTTDSFYYTFDNKIRDTMHGMDGNCPAKPDSGSEEYAISYDGSYIAFTTQLGTNQAYNLQKNIYLVETVSDDDAEQPAPQVLTSGVGRYNCPIFVYRDTENPHEWTSIVYCATHIANYEADKKYIRVYDRDTETIHELPVSDEYTTDNLQWTSLYPDYLFGLLAFHGHSLVVVLDADTGEYIRNSTGHPLAYNFSGCVTSFNLHPTTCDLFCTKSSHQHPSELFYFPFDALYNNSQECEIQITNLSGPALADCILPEAEDIFYTGSRGGDTIHGFYFNPVDVSAISGTSSAITTGVHPFIMYVHGGPESSWTVQWSDRWNPQYIANQGFALFAPNFHGGDAYGQWFTESIIGNWGTLPYYDIISGLCYILANKKDVVDQNRVGAMGASFGGFMMNWLQTHTNVFKAIVCHDGIFDLPSQYYETDELYSFEMPHHGTPWSAGNTFLKYSPAEYCQSDKYFRTPQLIMHGGKDFRCATSQGIQVFDALQGKGVPSRLIYFPTENHWVVNQQNSQRWHQEVFAWLKNYV